MLCCAGCEEKFSDLFHLILEQLIVHIIWWWGEDEDRDEWDEDAKIMTMMMMMMMEAGDYDLGLDLEIHWLVSIFEFHIHMRDAYLSSAITSEKFIFTGKGERQWVLYEWHRLACTWRRTTGLPSKVIETFILLC